jgi:hypothetical protein
VSDKQASEAHNDHNVYVLGAGFAADAGPPLVKDFMNRMRDAAAWLQGQTGRAPEIEAIDRVLEFRLRAAAAAYRVPLDVENIEELFSLASASGDDKLSKAMPLAIAATLDYARNTTPLPASPLFNLGKCGMPNWTKPSNWGAPAAHMLASNQHEQPKRDWYGCPPYEFYVGVMCGYFNPKGLDRRDTIITFNYDTVVEDALRGLGLAPDYGLPDELVEYVDSRERVEGAGKNSILVLKPHGSVNWAALSPEQQERLVRKFLQVEIDQLIDEGTVNAESLRKLSARSFEKAPIRRLRVYKDYEPLRKDEFWSGSLFLVPPTWQKRFGSYFLGAVWDRAVAALRTATRVIILGYSIPPTDLHFRYLVAAGLQANISLRKVFFVNLALSDERAKPRIEGRLFGLFRREHFDQGVIELVPKQVSQFFGEANNQEPHRLQIGGPLNAPSYQYDPASPWRCYSPTGLIQV